TIPNNAIVTNFASESDALEPDISSSMEKRATELLHRFHPTLPKSEEQHRQLA
ncbi:hypothetical protein M378DRAFT_160647, partial [Amanita muscaria Koide BX008]